MHFAIRAAVASAIMVAFYLTRGFGSFLETFVMAAGASLAGHGASLAVKLIAGTQPRSKAAAGVLALCVAALAGSTVFVAIDERPGPIVMRRVDEVMARPASFVGDEIKLHGYLTSITTHVANQEQVHRFVLKEKEQQVTVSYRGVAPETLKDRAEVVARGRLERDGATFVFVATEVLAKCPSVYNTAEGPVPATRFY